MFGWLAEERMLTKLPICEAQEILKPECTVVHEASSKIWQNFEETKQTGEFSSKHYINCVLLFCGSVYQATLPWQIPTGKHLWLKKSATPQHPE
jgi:hypothetical protein